jgi:hypothetical protein
MKVIAIFSFLILLIIPYITTMATAFYVSRKSTNAPLIPPDKLPQPKVHRRWPYWIIVFYFILLSLSFLWIVYLYIIDFGIKNDQIISYVIFLIIILCHFITLFIFIFKREAKKNPRPNMPLFSKKYADWVHSKEYLDWLNKNVDERAKNFGRRFLAYFGIAIGVMVLDTAILYFIVIYFHL